METECLLRHHTQQNTHATDKHMLAMRAKFADLSINFALCNRLVYGNAQCNHSAHPTVCPLDALNMLMCNSTLRVFALLSNKPWAI